MPTFYSPAYLARLYYALQESPPNNHYLYLSNLPISANSL
jgi:hypothetical protein